MKVHVEIGQYEFVEVEAETPEQAKELYNEIKQEFKGGEGLDKKEWNKALDLYLEKGTGDVETYQQMSEEQKAIFQEIKRSLKRINYKNTI